MLVDLSELSPNKIYHTFIQTIIPRPIAWTITDNGDGSLNLAPFSYFNGLSSNPPLVTISIGKKPDGSKKDTWVNIEERSHFVANIAHRELAEKVTASAASLPHGESELEKLGLETAEIEGCPLPRLKQARIAFVCEKHQIIEVGDTPQGLVIGRVRYVYVDDSVAEVNDGRMSVDPAKVDPLGRIGGNDYALFGETITVERPK